jgi:hypothetical protein
MQSDSGESPFRSFRRHELAHATRPETELDILTSSEVRHKVKRLEYEADRGPAQGRLLGRSHPANIMPHEDVLAG